MNPFEPKSVLLCWSLPATNGVPGTYVPGFGGFGALWVFGGGFVNASVQNARYPAPFDILVREVQLFEQLVPPAAFGVTFRMFSDDGATVIATLVKPAATAFVSTRANRFVRKGNIMTADYTLGAHIATPVSYWLTAVCEQVSL